MRITTDVIDCGGFYGGRGQPMYVVEADRPEHRQLVAALPVYHGEWWTLDCALEMNDGQRISWAKNTVGAKWIRIPMYSYNFKKEGAAVLPLLGFEMCTWLMRGVPSDKRLERVHLVAGSSIYELADERCQTWIGVGFQFE